MNIENDFPIPWQLKYLPALLTKIMLLPEPASLLFLHVSMNTIKFSLLGDSSLG